MNTVLNHSLSFYQFLFYSLITLFGTVIYSAFGEATGFTHLTGWINFFFLVAAAMLTLFSYSELITLLPKDKCVSLKKIPLNQSLPAFLAGYLIILNIITCCVTVALAYAGYINIFFTIPPFFIVSLLLLTYTIFNISNINQTIGLSIFLVSIEIVGLLSLITWGLQQNNASLAYAEWLTELNTEIVGSFLAVTSLSFFIYISFEDINNRFEHEIKPKCNLKQGILWSVFITLVIYLLILWISMGVILSDQAKPSMVSLNMLTQTMNPMISKALCIILFYFTASTALIIFSRAISLLPIIFTIKNKLKLVYMQLELSKISGLIILALIMIASFIFSLNSMQMFNNSLMLGIIFTCIIIQLTNIIVMYKKNSEAYIFFIPLKKERFPLVPLIGIAICIAFVIFAHYALKVYAMTVVFFVIIVLFYRHKIYLNS